MYSFHGVSGYACALIWDSRGKSEVRCIAESRRRMLNPLLIQLLSYASFLVFVIGSVLAVVRYATMPMHLRWELYPVAHEKGRDYGGSYLEDIDWWTKPRNRSLIGELRYMGQGGAPV